MRAPAVLAAVLLLAACGGGSERLTQEELRSRANAVCERTESRLKRIPPPADSAEGVSGYAGRALPLLRERNERLERLRPPEEDEQLYDRLLAETRREADALESLRLAAEEEDHGAAGAAARDGRIATVRMNVLALRLDLRECIRRPAT